MLEQSPHPVAERMAGLMVDRRAVAGSCDDADLLREFTEKDIQRHGREARRLAARRWSAPRPATRPIWQTDPAVMDGRVAAGAELVIGLTTEAMVFAELRRHGYSVPELTACWDAIMDTAARLVERRAGFDALRLRAMKFPTPTSRPSTTPLPLPAEGQVS